MSFINNWLRDDIQAMDAYQVPSADGLIKLDAMESPFSLSADLTGQYLAYLADAQLNRYPNPNAPELQQTLRNLMNVPSDLGVLLGNGSDELIQLLALACEAGDTILSIEPSFVMYGMIAKFTRIHYVGVPLTPDFELDLPAILVAIAQHQPKIIFIAYPNNPTGNAFKRADIEQIIQSTHGLVVLDEAYYAYADDSFLHDIIQYPNLVLLRTVSKIGFAGLRLGLLIGNQDTVAQLDKLRLPYNINTLSQVSGNFLLQETGEIDKNTKAIIAERSMLSAALLAIDGLKIYASQANFILFKAPNADDLFAHLKVNGILIKNLTSTPKLQNCLRVTIGTAKQNQQFIAFVGRFYQSEKPDFSKKE